MQRLPIYQQFSETECGITSLAMLMAYHGSHISFEELRDKCGVSRDGCKATTLIRVAKEYGFEAEAYSVDIAEIKALRHPVIAFWNFNHYLVIRSAKNHKFQLHDPAQGYVSVNSDEFDKSFTGVIIVLTPTDKVVKTRPPSIMLPLISKSAKQFRCEILFLIVCLLIISVTPILNSSLSTLFINYCVIYSNQDWLPAIMLILVSLTCILSLSTAYQKYNQFKLCAMTGVLHSGSLITHLLQLPLLFYSLRQKGELIAILSRVEIMINQLFNSLTSSVVNLLSLIICFIFMSKIDITLACTSLMLSLLTLFATLVMTRVNINNEKSYIHAFGKWTIQTLTCIRNLETIKLCRLKDSIFKKWLSCFYQKLNALAVRDMQAIKVDEINKLSGSIMTLSLFFIAASRIASGNLSIGHFMGYYALHLYFFNYLSSISRAIRSSQQAYVSQIRIHDLQNQQIDARFDAGARISVIQPGEAILSCHDVTFYYNKMEAPTLNQISLNIKPGQHIALTGKSGSGKSTLAKLLCGLYQPHAGQVKLHGRNISDFSPEELRRYFSYVTQDVSLFSGTIYDNLVMWEENKTPADIQHALQLACLDELISARGLYAEVDECGNNFSGGEKQRIEIARALIQDAPVLVLDEATSALDEATEEKLLTHLRHTSKTIIYVAHRASTINQCDKTICMDDFHKWPTP